MERKVGTVSRGIRCPIIREGDDLVKIVTESVIEAADSEGFALRDRDVVAMTESIVARAQGNYATTDAIAKDIKNKFGDNTIGVIFPILSRNRFAICLKGIAKGAKKIVILLTKLVTNLLTGIKLMLQVLTLMLTYCHLNVIVKCLAFTH